MLKKILVTILFIFTLAIGTANVSAANIVGRCGENLTYTLDSECTLTISGTGDMYSYAYIYNGDRSSTAPWANNAKIIRAVVISDGVTSIGDYAFYRCENVHFESITIPDSVTKIGASAFSGCSYIDELIIPDSVTSIGQAAFSDCLNLKKIRLPEGLTTISPYLAQSNHNLTEINIPDSVTKIGERAFYYDYSLKNISIPDKVTSIGANAFYNCSSLDGIELPETLTSIDSNAFSKCTKFTNITLHKNLKSLGNFVFSGCSNLESITVDSNNNNFLSVDGVLYDKKKTKLICYPAKQTNETYIIPDSVKTICSGAAYGCENLKRITVPSTVKTIEQSAFYGCILLSVVDYNGDETLWNKISIADYNDTIKNATKEYFWYVTYTDENGIISQKDMVTPGSAVTLPQIPVNNGDFIEYYADETLTTPFDTTSAINQNTTVYFKIVSPDAITPELLKNETGYTFTIRLNKGKIEDFDSAVVLAALYDGDNFIGTAPVIVSATDIEIPVTVETNKTATSAKIILLDGFANLKPLCTHAELSIN